MFSTLLCLFPTDRKKERNENGQERLIETPRIIISYLVCCVLTHYLVSRDQNMQWNNKAQIRYTLLCRKMFLIFCYTLAPSSERFYHLQEVTLPQSITNQQSRLKIRTSTCGCSRRSCDKMDYFSY